MPGYTKDWDRAVNEWSREVEEEAIRQVEQGVPPFIAQSRAIEIVRLRRQTKPVRKVFATG